MKIRSRVSSLVSRGIKIARLRGHLLVCAVFVFAGVKLFAQRGPLDDTAAFIHLAPNPVSGLACNDFAISIQMTGTNARVFDLRFVFDAAGYTVTSVVQGPHPALHVLPHLVEGDTLSIDGFFHPNFTGTTVIATVYFSAVNQSIDQSTIVGFLDGQGFSGTGEAPEPINMSGDSTVVNLEGSVPLPPDSVTIVSILADSVRVTWTKVTTDVDAGPVVSPWYLVEFEDVLNNQGVYFPIGATQDTFFYHDFIIFSFDPYDSGTVNVGTYRIKALKCEP